MSDVWKCTGCGATYADTQADGCVYFHQCPPLVDPATGITTNRPGGRDENLKLSRTGDTIGLKQPGAGIAPQGNTKRPEPQWITDLTKRVGTGG